MCNYTSLPLIGSLFVYGNVPDCVWLVSVSREQIYFRCFFSIFKIMHAALNEQKFTANTLQYTLLPETVLNNVVLQKYKRRRKTNGWKGCVWRGEGERVNHMSPGPT